MTATLWGATLCLRLSIGINGVVSVLYHNSLPDQDTWLGSGSEIELIFITQIKREPTVYFGQNKKLFLPTSMVKIVIFKKYKVVHFYIRIQSCLCLCCLYVVYIWNTVGYNEILFSYYFLISYFFYCKYTTSVKAKTYNSFDIIENVITYKLVGEKTNSLPTCLTTVVQQNQMHQQHQQHNIMKLVLNVDPDNRSTEGSAAFTGL